jgi:hypothetical protein
MEIFLRGQCYRSLPSTRGSRAARDSPRCIEALEHSAYGTGNRDIEERVWCRSAEAITTTVEGQAVAGLCCLGCLTLFMR